MTSISNVLIWGICCKEIATLSAVIRWSSLRVLPVVLKEGLRKNRHGNITEKCEWRENGEKKTCSGRRCFTSKQDCAKGRATANLQSQAFIWNSLNKQTVKKKKRGGEIITPSVQTELTMAFTQYVHPSTHPHTEATGAPRGLSPRPRVFGDWHATLRAFKAQAAAVLNLGGLRSGLLQASGTGSTRPMAAASPWEHTAGPKPPGFR